MTKETTKFMTPKQVAEELEISAATVVRWVREGTIPAKRFSQRIIKIERTDVDQILAQKGPALTKTR